MALIHASPYMKRIRPTIQILKAHKKSNIQEIHSLFHFMTRIDQQLAFENVQHLKKRVTFSLGNTSMYLLKEYCKDLQSEIQDTQKLIVNQTNSEQYLNLKRAIRLCTIYLQSILQDIKDQTKPNSLINNQQEIQYKSRITERTILSKAQYFTFYNTMVLFIYKLVLVLEFLYLIQLDNQVLAYEVPQQCLEIQRYYNKKQNYTFRDAIELTGSNVIILRASSNSGDGNFIQIIDQQTNQVLHSFSIDSSLRQMVYFYKKNKLFTISQDKLVERHIQYFDVIRQYQIPNIVSIQDIEDSDNEILILCRDQRAFRFDINTEEINKKYPLSLEGQKYAILNGFVKIITLKDYQIFARGGKRAIEIYATSSSEDIPLFQLFQRDQIQKNSLFDQSDIVGIDGTNLIAIQSYLQEILIMEIYLDKQDNKIKAMEKLKKTVFNSYPTRIFYMKKQMNHNLIVFYQQSSTEQIQFDVFVYQIIVDQSQDQSIKVQLKTVEIWTTYQLIKEDFSVLNFLPQSMRVYGIMNDQHLSYELLDGEGFECDYDGDGQLDSYCRVPKIMRFRKWDQSIGVFYLQDNRILIPNSFYGVLEIRNPHLLEVETIKTPYFQFQKVEVRRITYLNNLKQSRILDTNFSESSHQNKNPKWNFQYDQMNTNKSFRNLQEKYKNDTFMWYQENQYENQMFMIYDSKEITDFSIQKYFDIEYKKYLNKNIVAMYAYDEIFVGCIAFYYPDASNVIGIKSVNSYKLQKLRTYFQFHNLECYEMDSSKNIIKKYDLYSNSIQINNDKQNIMDCTINQQSNYLICKNNNSQLLFWSLQDFTFLQSREVLECIETTQLVTYQNFIYMNCVHFGTVIQFDINTNKTKIIANKSSSYLQLIKNGQFLIASAPLSPGFMIFDVNQPANSPPLFKIEDKNVCCQNVQIEYDDATHKVALIGNNLLMIVDLKQCTIQGENEEYLFDFDSCMQCTMDAFISYIPKQNFTYYSPIIYNKLEQEASKNIFNPTFLSIGNGKLDNPFESDLQIIEFYLKVEVFKNILVGFNQVKLRIFIDSTKVNPLNKYFFEWTQEKSIIEVLSFSPEEYQNLRGETQKQQQKQTEIDENNYSPAYVTLRQKQDIKIKYWNSLYFHHINVICTQCIDNLNISISYMVDLYLNNVQFLTYDGDDENNIEDIISEISRLSHDKKAQKGSKKNTLLGDEENNINRNKVKYIYPTFFLKKIDNTTIYSLNIENLNIKSAIMNFQSCQKVQLRNLNFNNNIVSSEIITSQQTYLKLVYCQFINNNFINPKVEVSDRPQAFNPTMQPIINPEQRVQDINKRRQLQIKQVQQNRTIILITFQNFNATHLLIKNNTFRDHLFFQGFIENQQFSIKTTFIFKNITFSQNGYDLINIPKVIFIQILLEVFLIAQHDVQMDNISIFENYQTFYEGSYDVKSYDSFYIQLSMIRVLNLSNVYMKSENVAGLIETKMVNFVKFWNFCYDDVFEFEEQVQIKNRNLKFIQNQEIVKKQENLLQPPNNRNFQLIGFKQKNENNFKLQNQLKNRILQEKVGDQNQDQSSQEEGKEDEKQKEKGNEEEEEGDKSQVFFSPVRAFFNSLFKMQETIEINFKNITVSYLHFINTIVINIFNREKELRFIQFQECKFNQIQITSTYHYIQVNLIQVLAQNSNVNILVDNNLFSNLTIFFNQNSDLKSSSGMTIQSLKSKVAFNNNTFANTSSNSVIGALSLDVSSLSFMNCTFNNNIFYGLEISENEIFSLNIGGFIIAKVDTISLIDTHFFKTFSSQGAIQIKSNQNRLEVNILKCTFKNIFAFSSAGSVLHVDSSQSILQMVIRESYFENIVQITNQYTYLQPKAVINIEKDYSFQNELNYVQFDNVNITNVITQFMEQKQTYFFNSFQSSFNSFFFIGSIINVQVQYFNIRTILNQIELIQFLQYIQQFKFKKLQQLNDKDKINEQIIHSPVFYLKEGEINLQNITYYGDQEEISNLIQKFSQNNFHENLFKYKKTLIIATQSTVTISNLTAQNLLVTKFIDISDSQNVELKSLFFEKVEQLLFEDLVTSNLEKISQSAIINLKKIENINIEDLQVYCDFNQISQEIKKMQFNDEQYNQQCLGQVVFIQESQFEIKNSMIQNYISPVHNGTAISILNPNNSCSIKNNRFNNLKTINNGGAIYIQLTKQIQGLDFKDYFYNYFEDSQQIININLVGNTFQFNQAEKGGCVYFENILDNTDRIKFQISQNKFYNNTSRLGSSIFYQNIVPQIDITNKFKQNTDDIPKSTVFSTPHLIKLVQTEEIKQILNFNSSLHWNDRNSDYIADITIASGQKLPALRFQFYFIHDFSQEINLVHLDLIQTQIPMQEYINIELSYDSTQQNINYQGISSPLLFFLRNKDDVRYDKEGNFIEFSNLQLLGVFNQSITLQISSPLIMHENKRLNQIQKNIKFKINVSFRECNAYEIKTKADFLPSESSDQIMQCYKCLDNTFARDGSICSECPQGAICKQEHEMQIQAGYWRKSLASYEIMQCFNELTNCKGGSSFGNQLCQEGYVGALCEECDLFAEVWSHSYTRQGNFKCVKCSNQAMSYFLIFLSHILTLIVAISSIVSNSESIKIKTIKAIYKQQRKTSKPIRSDNNLDQYNKQEFKQIQSGANLKILASYFSLMSCMSNFKFSLPRIIPEVSGVVGSPIAISMNAMDCLLVKMPISNKIPYIYFSFILKLFFPFIVFTAIITLLFIWNCAHKYKFQTHYYYTTFLFLYIFLQGDLVYESINLFACRSIAGEKYLLGNVNYQCNSENQKYEIVLVYPAFVILSLIFPICLLMKLIKNKQQLRKIRYQLRWGILYHEYKDECFYWEFIKISEKLLIIISISLFNQAQNIQLGVLIIILILYMLFLYKMKPFMLKKDNSMEFLSSFTILLTIILISISIQKQIQDYQYFIAISFIIAINALFILFISTKIYVEQYELFKQKKPMILIKCPQIAKFLNYLSEKLQNGWRGEQSANNSQKDLNQNNNKPVKDSSFQGNKQKKTLVIQDSSINQYNYPHKNKTQQDSNNNSENINNQFNSLSQDKSKLGFFHREECVEEFNSFGKSSYKKQKQNKIISASSIDSCNLEMVDVHEKNQQNAIPVSEFLARNSNVQSSQNNIISSYQKKKFSFSLNSQYQQSLQSTIENMKQRYFKRKQHTGVNFNQEMAKIKKVSTINNIIQNTSNLQTSQISSNLSVFTSNQDISSMQE
ncbi:hypothetical protein ABPG74_001757 [Tetrahymena malaccensis]